MKTKDAIKSVDSEKNIPQLPAVAMYDAALESIAASLKLHEEWKDGTDSYALFNRLRNLTHAEALIEFLEVQNCGWVGGFDINQVEAGLRDGLRERYRYLTCRRPRCKRLSRWAYTMRDE